MIHCEASRMTKFITVTVLLAIARGCCLESNVSKVIVDGTRNALSTFGGRCTFIQAISLFMAENSFNVTIITNKYDKLYTLPAIDNKIRVIEVKHVFHGGWQRFALLKDIIFGYVSGLYGSYFSRDSNFYITDSPFSVLPIKMFTNMKCLLYIHFPEIGPTNSLLKKIYNHFINYVINQGLRVSDVVVYNSHWTKNYSETNFPFWSQFKSEVIHPYFILEGSLKNVKIRLPSKDKYDGPFTFVSVNRFDPLKKLEILIEAMSLLKEDIQDSIFEKIKLKIAGAVTYGRPGWQKYASELQKMVIELGLSANIEIIVNPSHSEKESLLTESHTLLYSAINEHFGIGICDGFLHSLPVIASNSGGPLEIIDHGVNGFLAEPTGVGFAKYMRMLIKDTERAEIMGKKGHEDLNEKYLHRPRKILRNRLGQN